MAANTSRTPARTRQEDAVAQLRDAYQLMRWAQRAIEEYPEAFTYVPRAELVTHLVAAQHLITGVGTALQGAADRETREGAA